LEKCIGLQAIKISHFFNKVEDIERFFFFLVFKDAVIGMASKTRLLMNDELERIWKEAVVALKRYCPSEYLEGERQFANDLNRDSLCPTRDSNPERPEYMSISYELRIP
jgi:hypothetical protein